MRPLQETPKTITVDPRVTCSAAVLQFTACVDRTCSDKQLITRLLYCRGIFTVCPGVVMGLARGSNNDSQLVIIQRCKP